MGQNYLSHVLVSSNATKDASAANYVELNEKDFNKNWTDSETFMFWTWRELIYLQYSIHWNLFHLVKLLNMQSVPLIWELFGLLEIWIQMQ